MLKSETADAILTQSEQGEEILLQKSDITGFRDNKNGTCELEMSEWAAFKLGLI